MNFRNLDYLSQGSAIQQKIKMLLDNSGIMEILKEFDPVLVGTFPIDIAIDSSDLDIACCYHNKDLFISIVTSSFSHLNNFLIEEIEIAGLKTIIVQFIVDKYPIELFAQPIEVNLQNGYRHMLIEHKILKVFGEDFKQKIIDLKKLGLKTEPAFAKLLNLEGDSYESLLEYVLEN